MVTEVSVDNVLDSGQSPMVKDGDCLTEVSVDDVLDSGQSPMVKDGN